MFVITVLFDDLNRLGGMRQKEMTPKFKRQKNLAAYKNNSLINASNSIIRIVEQSIQQ